MINVLIIGSGGREHALAWKIKQSTSCNSLYVAPGNGGTALVAKNVTGLTDITTVEGYRQLLNFIDSSSIHLLVVGPEAPLVNGLCDRLNADRPDLKVIGPGAAGARLEGSKSFAKKFMAKYGIPTAASRTFTSQTLETGLDYIDSLSVPIVLKADGLAAGKGVIIAQSQEQAKHTLQGMLVDRQFGEASSTVVIEEFLTGDELSIFVLTDGNDYVMLPEAKDYKRRAEGDTGLNTGGMGAVSPVSFANDDFMQQVKEKVIEPTLRGLKEERIPYQGFLFLGLMNVLGEPYVIEYNVRLGDPETQVVLPRITSDFLQLLDCCASGNLGRASLEVADDYASTVVMVADGYPGSYPKGDTISGVNQVKDALIFHAGTTIKNGQLITSGGRVMAVTGRGDNLEKSLDASKRGVELISWKGAGYRKDIGKDLL
jgi:phosphoribosylamine---glycine ligase